MISKEISSPINCLPEKVPTVAVCEARGEHLREHPTRLKDASTPLRMRCHTFVFGET